MLSFGEKVKGFLFSPSETFDSTRGDTLGDAFRYYVVILLIFGLLLAVMVGVAFSLFRMFLGPIMHPAVETFWGPLFAAGVFILILVGGILDAFICGLWLHIWIYLVGGRNGVVQTLKAVMCGATPVLLFGWIPVLGIVASIWSLIVMIIGVRQLHDISTGKAVIAIIIAIVIPMIIFRALMTIFLGPLMPMPMTGPMTGHWVYNP